MAVKPNRYKKSSRPAGNWFRRLKRRAGILVVCMGVAAVAALGWYWQATLVCEAVVVEGNRHAAAADVRELAQIDSGAVLYDINPAVIRDRVRRHPWIRSASIGRIPTGTLVIEVVERTPAVLVVNERGRPAYYLDYAGYQMRCGKEHLHNVPLVHGLEAPYDPTRPVEAPSMQAFLQAMKAMPSAQRLVSSIVINDERQIVLHTVATPGGRAVPVQLGRGRYMNKLNRLQAFWTQVVLTREEQFEQAAQDVFIDLRFDQQVIVRTAG